MDEELDGVRVLAISKEMVDLLGMSYLKNNGVYGLLGSESAAKLFIIYQRRGSNEKCIAVAVHASVCLGTKSICTLTTTNVSLWGKDFLKFKHAKKL